MAGGSSICGNLWGSIQWRKQYFLSLSTPLILMKHSKFHINASPSELNIFINARGLTRQSTVPIFFVATKKKKNFDYCIFQFISSALYSVYHHYHPLLLFSILVHFWRPDYYTWSRSGILEGYSHIYSDYHFMESNHISLFSCFLQRSIFPNLTMQASGMCSKAQLGLA